MGLLDGQWGKLTNQERIDLCREYAHEAEQLAQAAHAEKRIQYKTIAAQWNQIAAELETSGKVQSQLPTEIAGRAY
jgi:hypothetical protein